MAIEKSNEPDAFRKFEHSGWETLGGTYEDHFGRVTLQAVSPTLVAAGIVTGMKVLDVCCGPGRIAAGAVARGAKVTGIDLSARFLEIAGSNAVGAEFVEGDAQNMAFDSDSFDAVICGFGLMHLPDPAEGLAEMRRVLRTGGRFATSAWKPPSEGNGYGLMMSAIQQHGDLSVKLPHAGDAFQFGTPEKMARAIEEAGFTQVTVEEVELVFECNDPRALIDGALQSAVRTRALLQAQTAKTLESIQNTVAEGMQAFSMPGGGFKVPMPIVVGAGVK